MKLYYINIIINILNYYIYIYNLIKNNIFYSLIFETK